MNGNIVSFKVWLRHLRLSLQNSLRRPSKCTSSRRDRELHRAKKLRPAPTRLEIISLEGRDSFNQISFSGALFAAGMSAAAVLIHSALNAARAHHPSVDLSTADGRASAGSIFDGSAEHPLSQSPFVGWVSAGATGLPPYEGQPAQPTDHGTDDRYVVRLPSDDLTDDDMDAEDKPKEAAPLPDPLQPSAGGDGSLGQSPLQSGQSANPDAGNGSGDSSQHDNTLGRGDSSDSGSVAATPQASQQDAAQTDNRGTTADSNPFGSSSGSVANAVPQGNPGQVQASFNAVGNAQGQTPLNALNEQITSASHNENGQAHSTTEGQSSGPSQGLPSYGQLPLSFEVNQGQVGSSQVDFLSRGQGYNLYLTSTEAVFVSSTYDNTAQASGADSFAEFANSSPGTIDVNLPTARQDVLRMQFVGANTNAQAVGNQQIGVSNYLIGDNPSGWHRDVPNYARVTYYDVYAGVDLVYYGTQQGQLEWDFIVSPGIDPGVIRLGFSGADRLEVNDNGDLVLHTPGGEVLHHAPVIYQEVNGHRTEVSGHYVVYDNNQVGFSIGAYDMERSLVVDPVLS